MALMRPREHIECDAKQTFGFALTVAVAQAMIFRLETSTLSTIDKHGRSFLADDRATGLA
jgi:hypothetical protein